jgi:PAS domain S-box-containing protein
MLSETFGAFRLSLYQTDASQAVLRLLSPVSPYARSSDALLRRSSSAARLASLLSASQQRAPLLVADRDHPGQSEIAVVIASLGDRTSRSCLCLPLWCGETLEGIVLAEFVAPLEARDLNLPTFIQAGLHLASALSSARLHLEVTRQRSEMRNLLEQLPEGIVVTEDTSGLIRYANPMAAQILGVALEDLIGAPLQLPEQALQQLSAEQQPLFFWTFAVVRALSGETLSRVETVVVRPDGTQVPVLCSSTPLRTAQGSITGAILVLQDITMQKRLERDKNAFLALASHELRTPLTTVLGYADMLKQVGADPERLQHDPEFLRAAITHISLEAEQMAFLIDEMLDLSSLDRDQLTLHRGRYNLVQLLTQVVETLAQTTEKHQLRLVLEGCTPDEPCLALVDAIRMTQALRNLVNNAMKYSPQGGEVEIGMRLERYVPPQALLWVKDHGLGITREDLPHIFERFYRSQKLDRAISGLGVGLYLVKQVVTRHGGSIWVESAEGCGSTFFVRLPLEPSR